MSTGVERIRQPGTLLEVRDLHTQFSDSRGTVRAADGVSFDLERGEVLALVGEAGAGKSAIVQSILRLLPGPTGRVVAGQILFDGVDLLRIGQRGMASVRGTRIGYVPPDPARGLDPGVPVGVQVGDALGPGVPAGRGERQRRIEALLLDVGIEPDRPLLASRPGALSPLLQQRIAVAAALAGDPPLIVADDPVGVLDPLARADVLRLLARVRQRRGHAQLLTSRDPAVAADCADRAAVLYAGRVVETGAVSALFSLPRHPYTQLLWRTRLGLSGREAEDREILIGEAPRAGQWPPGCPFEPRCPLAHEPCASAYPPEIRVAARHGAACWLLEE